MFRPPCRLVVMAALLLATRGDSLGDEAMCSVATALTADELRACDHVGVRRQLHSCVANLVAAVGPRCAGVSKLLFLSLLQLKAAGDTGLQDLVSVRNLSSLVRLRRLPHLGGSLRIQKVADVAVSVCESETFAAICVGSVLVLTGVRCVPRHSTLPPLSAHHKPRRG